MRRLRVGFFRAAWRMERVPKIAGSITVLERVEPGGSFGNGCRDEGLKWKSDRVGGLDVRCLMINQSE